LERVIVVAGSGALGGLAGGVIGSFLGGALTAITFGILAPAIPLFELGGAALGGSAGLAMGVKKIVFDRETYFEP
jgi:hypothetical protein